MSPRTAGKRLERMKTFFKFVVDSTGLKTNPAKSIAAPKVEESESVPFSEDQVETLLKACDSYDGNGERLKALSMLLLESVLRISDACTISRDKIIKDPKGWKVELRTAKTGTEVYCPIPDEVAQAVINQPGKQRAEKR